jgi:hypothetical protein
LVFAGMLLCALTAVAQEPTQVYLDTAEGRRYQLALNRANAEAVACYNKAIEKSPSLAGRLELRVTVEPSGVARSVEIKKDTLRDKTTADCIAEALKGKTWPNSPQPVFFDAILTFMPRKTEAPAATPPPAPPAPTPAPPPAGPTPTPPPAPPPKP